MMFGIKPKPPTIKSINVKWIKIFGLPSGGSREIETTTGFTDMSGRSDRDTTSIEAGI